MGNATVKIGSKAVLTCTAYGEPVPTVEVYRNGIELGKITVSLCVLLGNDIVGQCESGKTTGA